MKTTIQEDANRKFESASGIPLKEMYKPEDLKDFDYDRDLGEAGEYPYTRGLYKGMFRNRIWTRRFLSGFGSAKDSMERLKYLASIGSEGVEVVNDYPTQVGIDADHPMAVDEAGLVGIPVSSLDDVETILEGFPIDKTTITFESSGASGPVLPCMFFAMAQKQGVPYSALNGGAALNLYCQYYSGFVTPQPLDLWSKLAVDVVEYCSKNKLRFATFHTSAHNVSEEGTPAVMETALGFASTIAFADRLVERGLNFDEFANRVPFTFTIWMDFFEEIAKFRASRRIWAKIARERYGSKNPRAQKLYIAARVSGLTAIAQQPLNNIGRIAVQLMSAALGGCNAIDPVMYDEPLCLPTEVATRIAMCTQNILAYETGIANVVDPLAGSYYVEWLTNEVEKRSWELLQKILDKGGLEEGVKDGWIRAMIDEAALKRQTDIESGDMKLVGINDLVVPPEQDHKIPIHVVSKASTAEQVQRVKDIKKKRNNNAVKELIKKLVEEDKQGNVNLTPTMIEACKEYATIGEIWGSLRVGRGHHYDPFEMIESPFKD
ncbi:MAG: methylmalonyl-CoA mutase [Proteobacteria bacterium]|nr:methylmalonyl-CoA mutase [Pseudomonadota bacterium]